MLGQTVNSRKDFLVRGEARSTHLYVCGASGAGKSKLLEHLVRQDIKSWCNNQCGLLLIDPHGSMYDGLMSWLAWHDVLHELPIIPIDLRRDDWIVGYNLLRQRQESDPQVIMEGFIQSMAHVWGQQGTQNTPQFARCANAIISTLYEHGLTLVDGTHLINRIVTVRRNRVGRGERRVVARGASEPAGSSGGRIQPLGLGGGFCRARVFFHPPGRQLPDVFVGNRPAEPSYGEGGGCGRVKRPSSQSRTTRRHCTPKEKAGIQDKKTEINSGRTTTVNLPTS